jgi:Tfp pilus assembly protein PilF
MKSAFAILSSLALVLCVHASITNLPTKVQLQNFETVTLDIAKKQYESGEMAAAKQNLLAVLKADPKNARARYYLHLIEQVKIDQPHRGSLWFQTIPQQ